MSNKLREGRHFVWAFQFRAVYLSSSRRAEYRRIDRRFRRMMIVLVVVTAGLLSWPLL